MPVNFELISTYTVPAGGATTISFNSIPQTFKDLWVVVSTNNGGSYIRANGVSSTSYEYKTMVYFDSYPVRNYGGTLSRWQSFNPSGAITDYFSSNVSYFPDYTNTTYTKSIGALFSGVNANSNSDYYWSVYIATGNTQQTTAITSLVFDDGGTMAEYSKISLYGITNS